MYTANGKTFELFWDALQYAKVAKCEVILVEQNRTVWHPAPPVSAKRMQRYLNQKAAYEAQQRAMAAR